MKSILSDKQEVVGAGEIVVVGADGVVWRVDAGGVVQHVENRRKLNDARAMIENQVQSMRASKTPEKEIRLYLAGVRLGASLMAGQKASTLEGKAR